MKKVLIITYYWPPSGGAGVQRWLRFVKHLRENGYEPIIYTADNPNYALYDEKLLSQVPEGIRILKTKIKEPNNLLSKFSFGKKKEKGLYNTQQQKGNKRSFIQKVSWFVRGNFFIPDARFLWIKPSVKYLTQFLEKEKVDIIISSGPPHSLHLIAKKLNEKLDIPWIADFRDPWTSMDYLDEMYLTKWARKKHARLEKSIITAANEVVVVGNTMYNEYLENYNRKTKIIYNGFDAKISQDVEVDLDGNFTIVHIGSFLKNRNCNDLWKVLAKLTQENENFRNQLEIRLIGNVAPVVLESIEANGLNQYLHKIAYIPFEETQKYLHSAQVLLLPIDRIPNADFVLTGKLFEYMKSKRPILLIGPSKGDAADIISSCNAGYCCDFDNEESIKETVLQLFEKFSKNENNIDSKNVEQFSGVELTKEMAKLFDANLKKI
ncbi:MAG TPA: glycosyltransferase [Crocinitomicaceae bacterium]|nr:glycosyltransferase [Crocinitomicaceae bacterium]